MLAPQFIYNAVVKKVVDGDTIDVEIDMGFKIFSHERVRLARINTPELNALDPIVRSAAQSAMLAVNNLVLGKQVVISTKKTDLYGRYLAEVYYVDQDGQQLNLSDELLAKGLAVMYGK
jgi:micrococcal nuclease